MQIPVQAIEQCPWAKSIVHMFFLPHSVYFESLDYSVNNSSSRPPAEAEGVNKFKVTGPPISHLVA